MGVSNSKNIKNDLTKINIIYNIENKDNIRLFGFYFVENNKNICKIITDNKEYEINAKYNDKKYKNNKLKIELKGINNIPDMSNIFDGCS